MTSNQTTEETRTSAQTTSLSRLVFPHGVANLTIRVDASMPETYRGEFYGPKPQVTEAPGMVTIDYPRFNPLIWGRTSASVSLSPTVPWAIDIRGGVSRWDGDLRQLELEGIEIGGGANQVNLVLPHPAGSVRIHVSGGASHLNFRRPSAVAARIEIGGGATKLALDDQYLGAVGGPVRLETRNFSPDVDRYEVAVGGGASNLSVVRQ